jgi:DNA-binding response OmpR family regulator
VAIERSTGALSLLKNEPFDIVVLDVIMPGMGGFEPCGQMRSIPAHRTTPVVFVNAKTDFENKVESP